MKILMVCMGNICRSPLAEGILKKKLKDSKINAHVESAGMEPYHIGQRPDDRAIEAAEINGIDISDHVVRLFSHKDFDKFDHIYVVDDLNLSDVLYMARNESDKKKVRKLMSVIFDKKNMDVPDPYYGSSKEFEKAYSLLDEACEAIANSLK